MKQEAKVEPGVSHTLIIHDELQHLTLYTHVVLPM